MAENKTSIGNSAYIEWMDSETLRYSDGEFSALVWVDYETGFFSAERIIRSSSIEEWEKMPEGCSGEIEPLYKEAIIKGVQRYFELQSRTCRVE
ncbi:hypothetical protein [Amantichitinum ursilacus]|uniref:Uncharacterized protein n=1 Tax=Amantichitinum ursilacus TaxID=857265 RepID=A0A0N0GM81_9NEIS|nr:hypothetical protein [Amantichitinum ursilacus]KPC50707.1 hypothetical protein WG78_16675 [Amantichitinum ursilacus]